MFDLYDCDNMLLDNDCRKDIVTKIVFSGLLNLENIDQIIDEICLFSNCNDFTFTSTGDRTIDVTCVDKIILNTKVVYVIISTPSAKLHNTMYELWL